MRAPWADDIVISLRTLRAVNDGDTVTPSFVVSCNRAQERRWVKVMSVGVSAVSHEMVLTVNCVCRLVSLTHLVNNCPRHSGCAYTHFQASTSCPCCRKPVSENNLFELVIAGPSQALQQSTKHCYQSIFTKQVSNKQPLSHEEMCTRLLKNFDDNRRAMRFVLKQFVVESTKQSELHRALHHTKEEYAQYKQVVAAEKAQSDQVNADLHNKVQGTKRVTS